MGTQGEDRMRHMQVRFAILQFAPYTSSSRACAVQIGSTAIAHVDALTRVYAWLVDSPSRLRRIKCDEAKPQCARCTVSGRQCEGYTYEWYEQPLQPSSPPSQSSIVRQPNHWATQLSAESASDEKHAFYIFRTQTLSLISGAMNRDFWTVDILQASQMYPAMWHAVLSLAGMYTSVQLSSTTGQTDVARKCDRFALRHCNISIQHLLRLSTFHELDLADKEVILMSSVLLMGLCSLRGDPKQAISIARHGLQLFHEWNYLQHAEGSANSVLSLTSVVAQLQQAQTQYFWLGGRRPPWLELRKFTSPPPKASFASPTDAFLELQPLISGVIEIMREDRVYLAPVFSPPTAPADPFMHYRKAVAGWKVKFENMLSSRLTSEEADSEPIWMLQIWLCCIDMALDYNFGEFELDFDKYSTTYEYMMDLAGRIMESQKQTYPDAASTFFSLGLTLCEPLYIVSTLCRDPVRRRKAVSMLRGLSRTEGMWQSEVLASAAEAKMHIEESAHLRRDPLGNDGCTCIPGSFICLVHRVAGIDINFVGRGTATVGLKTIRDVRQGLSGEEVTIHF